ncbi:MAG: HupE/UreJ family protein [Pseudomonadota bacterium]
MRALLLAVGLLLLGTSVAAHQPSDAYLKIEVDDRQVTGRWDIALRDLDHAIGLDRDQDGQLTWGEVRLRERDIAAYALARLSLGTGDTTCATAPEPLALDRHGQQTYAALTFVAACPTLDGLSLRYDLLFDLDRSHRGLLSVAWDGTSSTAVLGPDTGSLQLDPAGASASAVLTTYLSEGFRHILIGYDHILFLLALLLSVFLRLGHGGAERRRALIELATVISAFTVGHSITLALAVLDVVDPPARLIESVIAASVVLAALNNILPMVHRRLWLIALGFGLVHGFGFAGVLRDLGLPDHDLMIALLGFNIGVELGQLAIVVLCLPLVWAIQQLDLFPRVVMRVGSGAIAAAGALWLIERAFDLQLTTLV